MFFNIFESQINMEKCIIKSYKTLKHQNVKLFENINSSPLTL